MLLYRNKYSFSSIFVQYDLIEQMLLANLQNILYLYIVKYALNSHGPVAYYINRKVQCNGSTSGVRLKLWVRFPLPSTIAGSPAWVAFLYFLVQIFFLQIVVMLFIAFIIYFIKQCILLNLKRNINYIHRFVLIMGLKIRLYIENQKFNFNKVNLHGH